MFNLIKRLPSELIIIVGIYFAYGNITGMDYFIEWKYIWPFLVIIFGAWQLYNEKKYGKNKKKGM